MYGSALIDAASRRKGNASSIWSWSSRLRVIGLEKIQARAFGIDGRTEGPVSSLEVNIVNRFTILNSGDGPILKGDPDYPYDSAWSHRGGLSRP